MISDLAHTAFSVYDIDVALDFYAKLGLTESFRLKYPDGRLMLIYLHISGDRFLELFPNGPEPGTKSPQSFRHICLQTDDLIAAVESLRNQGVTIDREPTTGLDHNLQAWITDPDGNPIELMQISDESPQRATQRAKLAATG